MSGIAHHLLKRGLEATHQNYQATAEGTDDGKDGQIKLPAWAIAMFWVTFLTYLFVQFIIKYTYGNVVATLTIVESPTATAFTVESTDSEDPDAALLLGDQKPADKKPHPTDPELFLVKTKPITSKIRTTIKHLKARAGRWSRFRGLQVAIVYQLAFSFIVQLFSRVAPSTLVQRLFAILAHVILARVGMTWTHIVMSDPSPKRWWRRFPSIKALRNILLPTAVWATAEQLALFVPMQLGTRSVQRYVEDPSYYRDVAPENLTRDTISAFAVLFATIFIVLAVVVPAEVTMVRVQASMLPEEDEAIVPFDRTFGGKVEPEIVGGKGCVSMLDAWKTFDWAARFRLIKLYAKVFALQFATTFMFVGIVIGELRLAMGDDFNKVARQIHDHLRR